jgi:hypothetical protein
MVASSEESEMSFENEGLPVSWDEIKKASSRLDWGEREKRAERLAEKRSAREFLSHTECDDSRVKEHIAIPGYN